MVLAAAGVSSADRPRRHAQPEPERATVRSVLGGELAQRADHGRRRDVLRAPPTRARRCSAIVAHSRSALKPGTRRMYSQGWFDRSATCTQINSESWPYNLFCTDRHEPESRPLKTYLARLSCAQSDARHHVADVFSSASASRKGGCSGGASPAQIPKLTVHLSRSAPARRRPHAHARRQASPAAPLALRRGGGGGGECSATFPELPRASPPEKFGPPVCRMYSIRDVAHTINNRALQRPQRAR